MTGGAHLAPIEDLIRAVLRDAGVPDRSIHQGRDPGTRIPGWYREGKQYDTVVMDGEELVLVIECKSQVGSFGNNQNNRIEEAIGQTVDFWTASREGWISELRPWFGYVMVVEENDDSTRPVRPRRGILPRDREFLDASYVARYGIAFDRMYREGLVDAAVCASAAQGEAIVAYPTAALGFQHFAVEVHNRIRSYKSMVSGPWR